PRVATALHKIGIMYESKEDDATALTYFQRALDMRKKVLGPDHEMTLFSAMLVGGSLTKLHRCPDARPVLEAAEAGLLKKVGENHADYLNSQEHLARCELEEGKPEKSAARLARAIAIKEKPGHRVDNRGQTRMLFARALWASAQRPSRRRRRRRRRWR